MKRYFTTWLRFIPRYFILFDIILNFFFSLSDGSLLMYTKATDFCILILYPATLPNSFLGSNSFLWRFKCFLYIVSCHLQIVTVLSLHFPLGCLLFFSCMIAVARTSNAMLTRSGESGHTSLIPDFSKKAFSFHH